MVCLSRIPVSDAGAAFAAASDLTGVAGYGAIPAGGALAIGVCDNLSMLEYSIYSVISPEGCASILYKNPEFASNAAEAMKITANDLKKLNLIDEIISEPLGGAHRNIKPVAKNITNSIVENLKYLTTLEVDSLIKKRKEKIMSMGIYSE